MHLISHVCTNTKLDLVTYYINYSVIIHYVCLYHTNRYVDILNTITGICP